MHPLTIDHGLTETCGQGIYIGDELLGLGVLVKDLTAILELCKAVWPEGVTCAQHRLSLSSQRFADRALFLPRKDYNEEWFPINDPTWHDKSGQPYGKVPAALDWISYDVRTAATLVACVESDETNHPDHVRSFTGSTMPPGCNRCVNTRRTSTRR